MAAENSQIPGNIPSRLIDRRSLEPEVRYLGPERELQYAREAATNRRYVSRDEQGNLVIPPRHAGARYTQA
jgi:hypothetical protein